MVRGLYGFEEDFRCQGASSGLAAGVLQSSWLEGFLVLCEGDDDFGCGMWGVG